MKGFFQFRTVFRAIALCMLATQMIGCGKPDTAASGGDSSSGGSALLATMTLEEAMARIQHGSVMCEDKKVCSPAVGMIAVALKDGIGRCTAFLVGPDILLTNSHCVPTELRAEGSDLESRMFAYFPETQNFPAQSMEVDHVISASQIDEDPQSASYSTRPDYAFLRLKKAVFRDKLVLSVDGADPDTQVNIEKVNPSKYTLSGTIVDRACQTARSNSLLKNYVSGQVPLVSLVDCDIVQGNSGSPVIGGDGRVLAVIFAGSGKGGTYYRSIDGETVGFANMARATNLACVPTPWSLKRKLPADCRVQMAEPSSSTLQR